MRKIMLVCSATALVTGGTAASAQQPASATPAQPTLDAWLTGEFNQIVSTCIASPRLKVGRNREVSPVPPAIRRAFETRLAGRVNVFPEQKLTTLFGTTWGDANGTTPLAFPLGNLDYSFAGDRYPFQGLSNVLHTHNCSSVLGYALDAEANLKLTPAQVKAALKSSYENTGSLSVSMASGRFYSPIAISLGLVPSVQQTQLDPFAVRMAVWEWYRVNRNRIGDVYIVDRFDGVARYRYSGLTLDTDHSGTGTINAGMLGVNADISGSGSISASGSTTINDFALVTFPEPDSIHRTKLPDIDGIAADTPGTAAFQLVAKDSHQGPILNTAPLTITHAIRGIPPSLCNTSAWTPNNQVQSAVLQSTTEAGRQICVFKATYKPPAVAAVDGAVQFQYTMTNSFRSGNTARNLVLKVPERPMSITDGRSAVALEYLDGSLAPQANQVPSADSVSLTGTLRYRLRTSAAISVTGVLNAPVDVTP